MHNRAGQGLGFASQERTRKDGTMEGWTRQDKFSQGRAGPSRHIGWNRSLRTGWCTKCALRTGQDKTRQGKTGKKGNNGSGRMGQDTQVTHRSGQDTQVTHRSHTGQGRTLNT